MKTRDFLNTFDGHVIMKKHGVEIVNTIASEGDIGWDAFDYEIEKIESMCTNVAVLIVR